MKLWFTGGQDNDEIIRERFGDLVVQAREGKLGHWEDMSEGAHGGLAFIILLDQFCRMLYRGTERAYNCDNKALDVTLRMIEGGLDRELNRTQRLFAYLPLEHAECLQMQEKCVQMFKTLATDIHNDVKEEEEEQLVKMGLVLAEEHLVVIQQFGRFPKRNKPLGRVNTPEEDEFLKNCPYRW